MRKVIAIASCIVAFGIGAAAAPADAAGSHDGNRDTTWCPAC